MNPRRKWIIMGAAVIVLAIGAEVAVRHWSSLATCVQVVNEGVEPVEDLVLSYAGTEVSAGRLEPGKATRAWFTSAGRRPIHLDFNQKGNVLKGFDYEDFNPDDHLHHGQMLVLVIKPDGVDRYVEDDDRISTPQGISDRIIQFFVELPRNLQ